MRGGFHTDDNTIWQFAVNAGDGMGWDGSQIGVDWMRSGGGGCAVIIARVGVFNGAEFISFLEWV